MAPPSRGSTKKITNVAGVTMQQQDHRGQQPPDDVDRHARAPAAARPPAPVSRAAGSRAFTYFRVVPSAR